MPRFREKGAARTETLRQRLALMCEVYKADVTEGRGDGRWAERGIRQVCQLQ